MSKLQRLTFLLFLMLLPLSVLGQKRFYGFEASYKSDINRPGIGFQYGGHIGDSKFRALHNYSFFLPISDSFTNNGTDFTSTDYFWELNTSLNYLFSLTDKSKLYPILALYLRGTVLNSSGGGQNFSSTNTRLGPSLGIGYEHHFDAFFVFSEAIYSTVGFTQIRANAGIRIPFDRVKPPKTPSIRSED